MRKRRRFLTEYTDEKGERMAGPDLFCESQEEAEAEAAFLGLRLVGEVMVSVPIDDMIAGLRGESS